MSHNLLLDTCSWICHRTYFPVFNFQWICLLFTNISFPNLLNDAHKQAFYYAMMVQTGMDLMLLQLLLHYKDICCTCISLNGMFWYIPYKGTTRPLPIVVFARPFSGECLEWFPSNDAHLLRRWKCTVHYTDPRDTFVVFWRITLLTM